jgi:hypothetical protein
MFQFKYSKVKDMALLQKHLILTKESSHKAPHLDRRKKNHLVNLDK